MTDDTRSFTPCMIQLTTILDDAISENLNLSIDFIHEKYSRSGGTVHLYFDKWTTYCHERKYIEFHKQINLRTINQGLRSLVDDSKISKTVGRSFQNKYTTAKFDQTGECVSYNLSKRFSP